MKLVQLEEKVEKLIREVVDAALKSAGSNALNHALHILSWLDASKASYMEDIKKDDPK